jgi:NO-binding membrane sensor protein with MHYT domain
MSGTYNPWLVAFSIIVAVYVSYTALNLAARMARNADSDLANLWLAGGAVAMGSGIWSMHFIGMLAFSLPIALSYDVFLTAGSLVIAIAISGFALLVASRPQISIGHLSVAAVVMGIGISAMHYAGMAAIEIEPMVTYEPGLLLASVGVAIGASFAALWLFFRLREGRSVAMQAARLGAAFVMGLAISGMHYTGMAASQFSAKAVCISSGTVDTRWLAMTTGVVAIGVLSVTTLLLFLDSHRHALASKPA